MRRATSPLLAGALLLLVGLGAPAPALAQSTWPVELVYFSDVSCPDRAALGGALGARGIEVAPAEQAVLRLELGMRGTELAATLRDGGGQVLAERALPAGACDAIADAIAVLVERCVQGVDWEGAVPQGRATTPASVPPPVAPPPRAHRRVSRPAPPFFVHAQAGVVFGNELEQAGGRPGPSLGLRFLPSGVADVALQLAWQRWSGLPIGDLGTLDVDRVPVALSASLALRRQRWEARAGAAIQLDVLSLRSHLTYGSSPLRAALRAGPQAELCWSPFGSVWVGLAGGLPIKILGYELVASGVGTIDRQARLAFELGAWVGARFRT